MNGHGGAEGDGFEGVHGVDMVTHLFPRGDDTGSQGSYND